MAQTTFTPSDAQAAVRRNLDELDPNGSIMYVDESGEDNLSLDNLIERFLPEAINVVNMAAPVALLEGKTPSTMPTPTITDHVMSFDIAATENFLRLVAFRENGSDVVITDPIPEASAEGRKQLNKHIRGTKDRPRLVMLQDHPDGKTKFKYYTTENTSTGSIAQLSYVQEQEYTANASGYSCSARLKQNYIDYITARVMETFNDARAQTYYQKAASYPAV